MTLNRIPAHPGSLCYVLKLHRDSKPERRQVTGLLEHVGTGHVMAFADAEALVAALMAHAITEAAQSYRAEAGDEA